MSPAVAIQETMPKRSTEVRGSYSMDIDTKFQLMLMTDKSSPEFVELWAEVDAFITAAVEADRLVSA